MKRLLASLMAVIAVFCATLSPVFADTTTKRNPGAVTTTTRTTVTPDGWIDIL